MNEALLNEIRETLRRNAIDCTYYVALGVYLARELSEKYGVPLNEVQGKLATVACEYADKMKEMLK